MAKVHGRLQSFQWNSVAVNGITDGVLNLDRKDVDVTTHDTGDAYAYIQGRLGGSVDLTILWDEADTGQSNLVSDFVTGTPRAVQFQMNTLAGLQKYTANGQVNKAVVKAPNEAPGEMTASITLTGVITKGVQ